jgi:DeoR family fructose operon transcriptional repressor
MSPNGISAESGLTTPSPEEAYIKQLLIKCSQKSFVIADHSKLGKVCFKVVCSFREIDGIITDGGADENEIHTLEALGMKVVVVPYGVI